MTRLLSNVKFYGPYRHRKQWRLVRRERGKEDRAFAYESEKEALEALDGFQTSTVRKTGRPVSEAIQAFVAVATHGRQNGLSKFMAASLQGLTRLKEQDFPVTDITPVRARTLYQRLVDDGHAKSTHQAALRAGRAWFAWLIKEGWVTGSNPFEAVEMVGAPRVRRRQPPKPAAPVATTPATLQRLLSVHEVATMLGLSPKGIYGLVETRRIPFVKLSNRVRFMESDVVAFLHSLRVPARS